MALAGVEERPVGMVLIGRRLSAGELRRVLDDPDTVDALLYGDLDDDQADMPEPELDLDKSWHAIHFLLTGTAWDVDAGAGAAILGGSEIGADGGYGPARLLKPEAVRVVAAALDAVTDDALRTRFDPAAMASADIYPRGTWTHADFDTYLTPFVTQLRNFYRTAATRGQAVLLALS